MAASNIPDNNRRNAPATGGLQSSMLTVEFSDRQTSLEVDTGRWERMLVGLLHAEGFRRGEISVSIVHDDEMHALNRKYLKHDYPTDVLSFVLDRLDDTLQGEIIVSADTAIARCEEFRWSADNELTLYLLHGALHLVGYQDKSEVDYQRMREREQHYLRRFGLADSPPRSDVPTESPPPPPRPPLSRGSGK
jgi:probable rRNA maturation factor